MSTVQNKLVLEVPVVSTTHVCKEGMRRIQSANYIYEMLVMSSNASDKSHGVFVFFGDQDDPDCNDLESFPVSVQLLAKWAAEQNYSWVRLDSGGDVYDSLTQYDW